MITCITLPENFWGTVISTLLGVTVGFILNYFKDVRKERKDKKIKKAEIIRKIVSTCKLYENFAFMFFEVISTNNYYKSRNIFIEENKIKGKTIPIELLESWRKEQENYRMKIVELESILSELISEFHTYFGKDKLIDNKRESIILMEKGYWITFDTPEETNGFSEAAISKLVGEELNKSGRIAFLTKDLISYVQNINLEHK